jgi:hypothetical protein
MRPAILVSESLSCHSEHIVLCNDLCQRSPKNQLGVSTSLERSQVVFPPQAFSLREDIFQGKVDQGT